MSEYPLSSDPRDCKGFTQVYSGRVREIETQKALRNPEPTEQLLSREEASRFLKISLSSLHRHVKKGKLPHVRIGARILFLKSSLEQHLRDKQILPDDFIPNYSPETLMTLGEVKELERKSKRMVEVSRLLQRLTKQEMDGDVDEMDTEQKKEFDKVKKAVLDEFHFLDSDLNKLEEIQMKRFRQKHGIPEPQGDKQ